MSTRHSLEWNNGMSVGIDSIDTDHKQLISIISELSEAIYERRTDTVISDIFERLEEYVDIHFTREELLMAQCNYPGLEEHIKQHRAFIKRIPTLKKRLLSSDSLEISEEVNLFLFNWLINHILTEDMEYAEPARIAGLSDKKKKPEKPIKRFISWMINRTQLKYRVVLTSIFPILFILFLSGIILHNSYDKLQTTQRLIELNKIILSINNVTHNLQAERGLSAGYISSATNNFHSQLLTQRNHTSHSLESLIQELDKLPHTDLMPKLNQHLGHIKEWNAHITENRAATDSKKISIQEIKAYYTGLINHLLDVPYAINEEKGEPRMSYLMTKYMAVLRLKEAAGLQRALGVKALEEAAFSQNNYKEFVMLNGEQKSMLRTVQHLLTPEQNKKWAHLLQGHEEEIAQKYLEQIFYAADNKKLSSLKSEVWFDLMSNKINQLKHLVDALVIEMNEQAHQEIGRLKQQFNVSAAILISIIILTSLLSWTLNYSIIHPVQRITQAMKQLARGQREMRFTEKLSKDEVGQMKKAYEACRISLLRADLADNIRFRRQHIDLMVKTEEREYFKSLASVDSLTGAINRREFFKIAQYEIDKVTRYKRPLSLIMIDIDHFKGINDTHGHAMGDQVLKQFYKLCDQNVRDTDIVARIGGEEFAILMPETDIEHAYELAERVREAIARCTFNSLEDEIRVTCSIGVVRWDETRHKELSDALRDADHALYKAKDIGRNSSVVYTANTVH